MRREFFDKATIDAQEDAVRSTDLARHIKRKMWRFECGLKSLELFHDGLSQEYKYLKDLWIIEFSSRITIPPELAITGDKQLGSDVMARVAKLVPNPQPYDALVYNFFSDQFVMDFEGPEARCELVIEKILMLIPDDYIDAVILRHQQHALELSGMTPEEWTFHS